MLAQEIPRQERSWLAAHGPAFRAVAGALLLAAITCVAYLPSLRGEFILDDDLNLAANRLMQAADGPYRFWFTAEALDYWPVFNTALWVQWRLWGADPAGYRIVNLALHITTAWLIWITLQRLSIPGSFLAALLFAVHPVNVESVAWITQLKNLLALLFSLVSTLCYLNAEEQGHAPTARRWYGLSLTTCALAMLSKGSAAVLPLLLLGVLRWRRPLTQRDLIRFAPFFVVAAAIVPVNVWFQSRLDTHVGEAGFVQRLLGAGAVVWFYLYKALLPVDLVFVYPRWQVHADQLRWWLPLLAAVATTCVLWRYRRGWGWPLLLTWGYFCVSLAPVLGFTDVGFMEHSLVADHYQHFALIGIVALFAAGWSSWEVRTRDSAAHWVPYGAAVAATAALTFLTWQQSSLYRDNVTLYSDTLEKNPAASMAHNNLGAILNDTGHAEDAIAHLQEALRLKPDYPDAENNLGSALRAAGRSAEAIEHYEQALRLKPTFAMAHYNLGIVLAEAGRRDEAITHYRQALQLDPSYFDAYNNLGNVLLDQGRPSEAIDSYEQALRIQPDNRGAQYNLGNALAQAGRTDEALRQYGRALDVDSESAEVQYRLAMALLPVRPDEAIARFRKALELAPDHAQAHNDLGVALVRAGQLPEAIEHFQRALQLQPNLPDAVYNLEIARKMGKNAPEGEEQREGEGQSDR